MTQRIVRLLPPADSRIVFCLSNQQRLFQRRMCMSHIVTIKTKVTDPGALSAACRRLALDPPAQGTAQLFSAPATGLIVKLPGWNYPVVADVATGEVKFDNYGGCWGKQEELDKL